MKPVREACRNLRAEPDVTAIIVLVLLFGMGWSSPLIEGAAEAMRYRAFAIDCRSPLEVDLEWDPDPGSREVRRLGVGPVQLELR